MLTIFRPKEEMTARVRRFILSTITTTIRCLKLLRKAKKKELKAFERLKMNFTSAPLN